MQRVEESGKGRDESRDKTKIGVGKAERRGGEKKRGTREQEKRREK